MEILRDKPFYILFFNFIIFEIVHLVILFVHEMMEMFNKILNFIY